MKTYKIKSEDKAALLNRLEAVGVEVNSLSIKDNESEDYFEITFLNDEDIEKMKTIIRQSPKIDVLKEFLRKLVREELSR